MHLLARPLCRARRESGAHPRSQRDLLRATAAACRTGCRSCSSTPTRSASSRGTRQPTAEQRDPLLCDRRGEPDLDRLARSAMRARTRARCGRWSRPRCGCSSTSSTTALKAIAPHELAPGNLTRLLDRDQGGLPDLYRHHRGHLLPRPGLVFLPARPLYRARRPDDPPARHQVSPLLTGERRRRPP